MMLYVIQWAGIDLKLEEGPRKNKPFKVVTIETLKIPLPSFLTHHKGNVPVLSPDSTPGAIPQLKLVGVRLYLDPQNHPKCQHCLTVHGAGGFLPC